MGRQHPKNIQERKGQKSDGAEQDICQEDKDSQMLLLKEKKKEGKSLQSSFIKTKNPSLECTCVPATAFSAFHIHTCSEGVALTWAMAPEAVCYVPGSCVKPEC